jgi:TonB family protein
MSNFFNKQRHQQRNGNLRLSLFGSILIHALVALSLFFRRIPQTLQAAKLTSIPITIAEQSQERSPISASGQSKPKSQGKPITPTDSAVKTKPTTPPEGKPKLTNATSNSVAKIVKPQPKIKPSFPATPKLDSPPVLTSNQTNIKSPKIITPRKVDQNVEKLIENNEATKSIPSAIATKPRLNPPINNHPRKPLTSSQGKPVKSETSRQENNRAFTPRPNNQESTQGKDSSPATNSEGSTEGQDEAKTFVDNVSSELEQPLAISCEENCQPEYPSVLDGAEGSTGIQLTVDRDGSVIDAAIALKNGNPQLDREALKAAQEMEFSSIERDRATVRINISFTVAGSDFEQQAKEEQEKLEQRKQERQEQLEELKKQ